VDELLGSGTSYRVVVPDPSSAAQVLTDAGFAPASIDGELHVDAERPADITRVLGEAGIWLTELTPLRADLEAYFLQLTEAEQLGRDDVIA
jgi:ABC-2 type transport system ATP-binding protein